MIAAAPVMLPQPTSRLVTARVAPGTLQRCGGTACPPGTCGHDDEPPVARFAASTDRLPRTAPPTVGAALSSGGRPLDPPTRRFIEGRFGHDLAAVRIHSNATAGEAALAVGARAYTFGSHIGFAPGQYAPETAGGWRLLVHELAHVVQQGEPGALPTSPRVSAPSDPGEVEASSIAASLGASGPPKLHAGAQIQRACGTSLGPAPGCAPDPTDPPGEIFYFETNCDDLKPGEDVHINRFVSGLAAGTTVRVHGFASLDGPAAFNEALSCHRANKLAAKLRAAPSAPSVTAILAHGPTAGPATSRRSAIAETTAPALPGPTAPVAPVAPTAPPPRFVCGPDITSETTAAVAKTRSQFAGWTATQKGDACDALISLTTGAFAWDIGELHNNAWILGYRPACASARATPACGSSVKVGPDCHYAGSVNYVVFGAMCELCNTHFTSIGSSKASGFTQAEMLKWINRYKGTGFTGLSTPSANFAASQDWAIAGFRSWPAVPGPAGDRTNCSPTCPTAYGGSAFQVHWVPHGWF